MDTTMERFVRSLLLLGTLVLPGSWAGSHSLRYFDTAMTRPGLGEPRFFTVGYLDDQQFLSFDTDSKSQRAEPLGQWMERMEQDDPEYRERETRKLRETAQVFRVDLETLRWYCNRSAGGICTIQRMYGCEVTPELGFRRRFYQYAYEGRDFIALDTETYKWKAAMPLAMDARFKWEESGEAERWKVYLEECVTWLEETLETLRRADPPSTRVTRHAAPHGEVTLRCRAQDFYPSDISLIWLRDGQELLQDTELIETRPAGDGTFQKWAAVDVTWGQEREYTCRVQHEDPPSSPTWLIVGGFAVGLLLLVAGFVIWRKKNSGSDSAQGSDVSLTVRA